MGDRHSMMEEVSEAGGWVTGCQSGLTGAVQNKSNVVLLRLICSRTVNYSLDVVLGKEWTWVRCD
jgi:hypothetical protein